MAFVAPAVALRSASGAAHPGCRSRIPRVAFPPPTRRRRATPTRCVPRAAADPPASPSTAERIAAAFIAACMPSDTPYAEQLSAFCREVSRAHAAGFSLDALLLELGTAAAGRSATALARALQPDEVELRSVWVTLCYKTLRARGGVGSGGGGIPDQWDAFVRNVAAAKAQGYDQKRIMLEQTMASAPGVPQRTPMESAVLQQAVRIVLSTLALDGEKS
jgi:hypothetical protein